MFHLATNQIYTRVISTPFPHPKELLELDQRLIGGWLASIPSWYSETAVIPQEFSLSHAVIIWRYRNFRIVMYRPFVIRKALQHRAGTGQKDVFPSPEEDQAYFCCLKEAESSIKLIHQFSRSNSHTRMSSWYAL
jgi:transcriptional regulatory protein GAL4